MDIIETAGISPNVIQSDNGGEFKGEFDEYLQDNHITHLFNSTYSPNQNAIVERANRDIRKIINNGFAISKTKKFYDIIDAVEEAKNNAYNSSIKCAPVDLWRPDKDIITKRIIPKTLLKPEDKKMIVAYENSQKALQKMEVYKRTDNFAVDDYVLLKMETIFSTMRKRIKAGESKLLPVLFAPILYRIRQVKWSRKPTTRNRYLVVNVDTNETVSHPNGNFKYMTANDMIKCANDNNFGMTIQQAIRLDGLTENENDLRY